MTLFLVRQQLPDGDSALSSSIYTIFLGIVKNFRLIGGLFCIMLPKKPSLVKSAQISFCSMIFRCFSTFFSEIHALLWEIVVICQLPVLLRIKKTDLQILPFLQAKSGRISCRYSVSMSLPKLSDPSCIFPDIFLIKRYKSAIWTSKHRDVRNWSLLFPFSASAHYADYTLRDRQFPPSRLFP